MNMLETCGLVFVGVLIGLASRMVFDAISECHKLERKDRILTEGLHKGLRNCGPTTARPAKPGGQGGTDKREVQ